jgi:hypothetical protein
MTPTHHTKTHTTKPLLRENPFHTYRDPKTGKWLVIDNPKPTDPRIFKNPKSI